MWHLYRVRSIDKPGIGGRTRSGGTVGVQKTTDHVDICTLHAGRAPARNGPARHRPSSGRDLVRSGGVGTIGDRASRARSRLRRVPVNPPVLRLATTSVSQTQALAATMAGLAQAGDLIVLAGEMGAGKTAFTQGFARGLGITEAVTSPTFTIVREHTGGRLNLHHLDVYRLDHLREVGDLGLAEMLEEDAVMLVEWGDAVLPALGDERLEVALNFVEDADGDPGDDSSDDHRCLEIRGRGHRWQARHRALAEALEAWAVGDEPC